MEGYVHVEVCEMVELTAWGPLHRCGPQMHVRLRLTQTVSLEVDSLQQPRYVQVCGVWTPPSQWEGALYRDSLLQLLSLTNVNWPTW